MAIALRASLTVYYVADGAGPAEVACAQRLTIPLTGIIVGGGASPSQANFQTALSSLVTTAGSSAILPFLAQIAAWSQGGP